MTTTESSRYAFKDHPETCAPDDFWGQVKRTVAGKPVSQDQIDMIVAAVMAGLDLQSDDTVLDLCCGNGALTTYMFKSCRGGLGVDYSDFLIDVGNKNFVRRETEKFQVGDVVEYAQRESNPEQFTKVMCYGAFQILFDDAARKLLRMLAERFTSVSKVFLGNLPDKSRIHDFYNATSYVPGIENDASSPIGIWRTEQEFVDMARAEGWHAEFRRMPSKFYAAHYRYDAILSRL